MRGASPQTCSSMDVLFNNLLAELCTILDSFFTNITSAYVEVVSQGWWGAMIVVGQTHIKMSYFQMGSFVL